MTHYAPLIAALSTLLVTAAMLLGGVGRKIQDVPNARSLHKAPVPRIGGAGLMAGILAAWAVMGMPLVWWILWPLLFLFVVSMLDDMRGLPVRARLLAHIAAAVAMALGSGLVAQNAVLSAVVILTVVWMTNLYNFMDGSDGLAGGMALFGFSAYGVAAWLHGGETLAWLNFCVAAAALGFLVFNFHPARVFMGDAGSIPLGFLAAGMGLWGWQQGQWPVWLPLLAFSPFVVDATVTLLKRAVRGAQITEAHREHYYQRLVQIGWGHRNVALLEYILMAAVGASAILGMRHGSTPWLLLLAWGAIYLVLLLAVDSRWQAFQRERHG